MRGEPLRAYVAGWKALTSGKALSHNPHSMDTDMYSEWNKGWNDCNFQKGSGYIGHLNPTCYYDAVGGTISDG